ncbi:hypothetical protein BH10ACT9_BH10ACT9_53430 [soil metagenome]
MLRVASVPGSHLYVRHLSDPDGTDSVRRLPDPVPADGRKIPGGWWPPLMLEPSWIENYHTEFDVFHVHFGFDALTADTLDNVVSALAKHRKPLVYTVHDLRNPHHREPDAHQQQQDLLVPAAQRLLTLTAGAAETIAVRWGRHADVLPHPHVLSRRWIDRPRNHRQRFVVGVHVKSLRANMDPFPVLDTLAATVVDLPDAILQINVHDEIFQPGNHWYAPQAGEALLAYGSKPAVDVRVHPYFSDDELWKYLSELTVSVLPYRFGTHSGWLEACYDLGTAVIAPSCGFYDQQRPCEVFDFDETHFGAASLDHAVRHLYARAQHHEPPPRATWPERHRERVHLARAHRAVYQSVLR